MLGTVSGWPGPVGVLIDRKSTRLNSSHANISYAVFCLKKKKKQQDLVHGIEIVDDALVLAVDVAQITSQGLALFLELLYPLFFFFNDTATTEIYTLSLHDALPILELKHGKHTIRVQGGERHRPTELDRKSTRLNSSHANISYAVFCLKKKKKH